MHSTARSFVALALCAWVGPSCAKRGDDDGSASGGFVPTAGGWTSASGSAGDGDGTDGAGTDGGTDAGDGDGDGDGESGPTRFDVNIPTDPGNPGEAMCEKIDFVFVIDNSGSMEDEQQSLIDSFPGFIETVQVATGAQDFRVMVLDTDDYRMPGEGSQTIGSTDCNGWCANTPGGRCNGVLCTPTRPPPNGCDEELGAGRVVDRGDNPCGLDTANRWIQSGQTDLETTFACLAEVGIEGHPNERPMEALSEALGPQNAPNGCNEGFIRDDAVLVITIITDEEDDDEAGQVCDPRFEPENYQGSAGDPVEWFNAVVAAKGVESNAVVLSLVGPTPPSAATDPAACPNLEKCTNTVNGAETATRIVDFTKRFSSGLVGRVCEASYDGFFQDAVGFIATACEGYVKPG